MFVLIWNNLRCVHVCANNNLSLVFRGFIVTVDVKNTVNEKYKTKS